MSVWKPTTPVDLAVVGGGAIGLAVAWQAIRGGLSVVVLERDRPGGGTSRYAAGMIAPIAEARPAEEPVLDLGLRSARLYPSFVAALQRASGLATGYTPCGTLLVARDDDEARHLERELALRARFGLAATRLRPSAARRLEPALTPSLRLALDVPDDHAVDPRMLTAALAAAVGAVGGVIREGAEVTAVRERAGRVAGVTCADGSELDAAQVVIAAGPWSERLAVPGLPDLRPVKGQILRLHDPAGPGLLTRVVRMGPSYVVPRGDGRYVIGGTTEERGFDTSVTAGAVFELLRDASELVPGVWEFVLDECSAALRPGSADNLPVIGPGALSGLHWATGHGRGGILLAPVTAALVCAGLDGVAPAAAEPEAAAALDGLDPAPFAPGRFARVAAGSPG
ncbi:MAG TPA: glycine oxidase ThiO [Solirubrobacteraceae bacterium]|nr:glycine oxidase ThiO [Solirubrobacteraceae bacterium]